jgi:hypothetical protein
MLTYSPADLPENLLSRMAAVVDGELAGCWLWLGPLNNAGYGTVRREGRKLLAHRVVYELLVGPIPEGLQSDHLCRVRRCVNPAHIEPVTPGENTRRAPWTAIDWQRAKTHCPHGHAYTPENIRTIPSRPGARYCRACERDRRAARRKVVR